MTTNLVAVIIIAALIVFWCMFDSRTLPGVTAPRPYGIAALVIIGAATFFTDEWLPYLSAIETFIASLFFLAITIGAICVAIGDYPTQKMKDRAHAIMLALVVVTGAVAYALGGIAGLIGAGSAVGVLVVVSVVSLFIQ